MNIAEHRLHITHQLEELSEESLCEIEKIIAKFKRLENISTPKNTGLKNLLASWNPLEEDFPEIVDEPPRAEDIF